MIPIQRLKKIPRSQRLRKIAKIFGEAEYRMGRTALPPPALPGESPPPSIAYLGEVLALLTGETFASPAASPALDAAAAVIRAAAANPWGGQADSALIRALNTVRHILLAETGRQTADWDFFDHQGRLDPAKRRSFPGMRVYLEDIRSPYNVGAMFRTAESFGAEKICLSPLCADPLHPRAARTAMGCVEALPWERVGDLAGLGEGPFFALETGGISLPAFRFPSGAVMLTGSEELGLSPEALELADRSLGRVTIPSYGAKGSLNVSVAFGIVMQAWAAGYVDR
ncbi:MAG: TrmH family RNA methyltransferase [Treponema sp.]|jgi:TrmH family RNA methyltransferase|nr:TrmH family RNA methyltransferase [Treponema sp.]